MFKFQTIEIIISKCYFKTLLINEKKHDISCFDQYIYIYNNTPTNKPCRLFKTTKYT